MQNQQQTEVPTQESGLPIPLLNLANSLKIEANELQSILLTTIMPANKPITNEQFVSFIAVASEYDLNPLTKEIYAFPAKGGGIQPIVSIDGWLKIINNRSEFDGMEFSDNVDSSGSLISVTCRIYRKDRSRPTEMTEYMNECKRPTDTWKNWPTRMLRHKATIQAARYAFGLSGIIDPDEAERYEDAGVTEKEINPMSDSNISYSEIDFNKNLPKWQAAITSGKTTAEKVIAMASTKGMLTDDQMNQIKGDS